VGVVAESEEARVADRTIRAPNESTTRRGGGRGRTRRKGSAGTLPGSKAVRVGTDSGVPVRVGAVRPVPIPRSCGITVA